MKQNRLFHLYRYTNPTLNKKTKKEKKQPYRKRSTRNEAVILMVSNGSKWFKSITVDKNITAFKTLWLELVLGGKIKIKES